LNIAILAASEVPRPLPTTQWGSRFLTTHATKKKTSETLQLQTSEWQQSYKHPASDKEQNEPQTPTFTKATNQQTHHKQPQTTTKKKSSNTTIATNTDKTQFECTASVCHLDLWREMAYFALPT
jgi:hypothetical protein